MADALIWSSFDFTQSPISTSSIALIPSKICTGVPSTKNYLGDLNGEIKLSGFKHDNAQPAATSPPQLGSGQTPLTKSLANELNSPTHRFDQRRHNGLATPLRPCIELSALGCLGDPIGSRQRPLVYAEKVAGSSTWFAAHSDIRWWAGLDYRIRLAGHRHCRGTSAPLRRWFFGYAGLRVVGILTHSTAIDGDGDGNHPFIGVVYQGFLLAIMVKCRDMTRDVMLNRGVIAVVF